MTERTGALRSISSAPTARTAGCASSPASSSTAAACSRTRSPSISRRPWPAARGHELQRHLRRRTRTSAGSSAWTTTRPRGSWSVNTAGDTSTPEAASPANDVREETLVAHVRHAAGVADLPVKITGVARWRATSDVARRFRHGRVFLAGDAAHLMPPNGGYGGNTGIHDGHNLAWKLAHVLKGIAGAALLDTYEASGGRSAVHRRAGLHPLRHADGAILGKKDFQPLADDFDIELGYLYRSAAIARTSRRTRSAGRTHEHPANRSAAPARARPTSGSSKGERISTLDLLRGAFVLLAGPDGNGWIEACARRRHDSPGFKSRRTGSDVDISNPPGFTTAFGIGAVGRDARSPGRFRSGARASAVANPAAALAGVLWRS